MLIAVAAATSGQPPTPAQAPTDHLDVPLPTEFQECVETAVVPMDHSRVVPATPTVRERSPTTAVTKEDEDRAKLRKTNEELRQRERAAVIQGLPEGSTERRRAEELAEELAVDSEDDGNSADTVESERLRIGATFVDDDALGDTLALTPQTTGDAPDRQQGASGASGSQRQRPNSASKGSGRDGDAKKGAYQCIFDPVMQLMQAKMILLACQQIRLHSGLLLDSAAQRTKSEVVTLTNKAYAAYARRVREAGRGHVYGPPFLHGVRAYLRAVAISLEFLRLQEVDQEAIREAVDAWKEPIDVTLHVKGFGLKDQKRTPMSTVSFTFQLGADKLRKAVIAYWKLARCQVLVGPPPPTPMERRMQREVDSINKSKGKGKGKAKSD